MTKAIMKVIAFREDPKNAKAYEDVRNVVHCARCGKELTDPESKVRGIGPECLEKEQANGEDTELEA
jgi:hypothetical protein